MMIKTSTASRISNYLLEMLNRYCFIEEYAERHLNTLETVDWTAELFNCTQKTNCKYLGRPVIGGHQ